ncbi:MAG: hypothetical protein LDL10_00950 [Calditerrivibrio sp.]|nr:hypothetical protein [Calditerrivibrio sp.]
MTGTKINYHHNDHLYEFIVFDDKNVCKIFKDKELIETIETDSREELIDIVVRMINSM